MGVYDYPDTVPAVLEAARDRIARHGLWGRDCGNDNLGYSIEGAVFDVLGMVDPFGGEVYDRTPRGKRILGLADDANVALAAALGRPGLRPGKATAVLMEQSLTWALDGGRRGERGYLAALHLFSDTIRAQRGTGQAAA